MKPNTTQLSISQVARATDMSVQNLRKTYINKGKLSVSKNSFWRPYIDLSECLRVFPDSFKTINDTKWVDNQKTQIWGNLVDDGFRELLDKNRVLETENQLLSERLKLSETWRDQAERREQWLQNHVDKLTEENLRLLPAPTQKNPSWMAKFLGLK